MTTAGSHFDANVSHDMVAFFFMITIPVDIFVFYYLHRISLVKPYGRKNLCSKFLFAPIYPSYYYSEDLRNNSDENNNSLNSNTSNNNDNKEMFSMNYGRICSQFLNNKHTFIEYCIYALQIWSFCCGFLAFYASFIFWMNLILQFFVVATGSSSGGCIFALTALYFIMEIVFWFIRREFESLILITRNIGDVLDIGLLPIVRLYNIIMCFICTIWTQFNSDNIGWKYFILFMLLRGLYHQMIYITISFFNCVFIVISSMKQCKHFLKLICVSSTDPNQLQSEQKQSKLKSVSIYVGLIWLLIILYAFFVAMLDECKHLYKVCIIMTLLYYILIMFERGKYNNLYLLWRDTIKTQFFKSLPAKKSTMPLTMGATKSVNTPPLQIEMQPSHTNNNSKNRFSIITNESEDELDEDEHKELEEQISSGNGHLTPIDYRQYWDKVNYNSQRRCKCFTSCTGQCNSICCKQYCTACCCSKDGCKWIFSIILFIIFLFATTGVAHKLMLFEEISYNNMHNSQQQFYPICDLKYSDYEINDYLTTMDLMYLSISAYHIDPLEPELLINDFKTWFGEDELPPNYVNGWQINHIDMHSKPYFYHIYNEQHDIDIISIRGEPNPGELLLDIGLWSEAAMFEIFSWVVPLTSILPKAFIRQFIGFVSIFENIVAPDIQKEFHEPVYKYILNAINITNDCTILFVGHSLGGSIGQIVSSKLYDEGYGNGNNIISFGLSTPGVVYSSGKFDFSVESLDKSSISIASRRDIITNIDQHGGFVQNIECNARRDEECHNPMTSFCQLYSQCNVQMIRNVPFAECLCNDKKEWNQCGYK